MKTIYLIFYLFIATILVAQDDNFVVSSSYVVFKDTSSSSSTLSVKNEGSSSVNVGTISIIGAHSDEFNITSDDCSSSTLNADSSCHIEVEFIPNTNGMKNALIKIPHDIDSIYVFLTNYEDNAKNVKKRLAPVIDEVVINETLNSKSSYDFQWSLFGYHDNYKVIMVMFDCTDSSSGTCGSSYSSDKKFLETPFLSYSSREEATWSYRGQMASKFTYTYSDMIPEKRKDGSSWNNSGTNIVIRFYIVSDEDENNNKSSLSLIVPGNITARYYDTSGRKIEKTICPMGGCF